MVLIVPFVLQTLVTVGLVGYFSFRNGQRTVSDLSGQLRRGITNRIEEKLKTYTEIPHILSKLNVRDRTQAVLVALKRGLISETQTFFRR
jgi:hypothetical protein